MYRRGRQSILMNLLGRSPQIRLLDFFMDNPLFDFSRREIIEALGMAKVTLGRMLPIMEKHGLIVRTRRVGKAVLYKLNGDSELVKNLNRLIEDACRDGVGGGI